MKLIFVFISFFLFASLPLKSIFNWMFIEPNEKLKTDTISIHFPNNIVKYLGLQVGYFLLGFCLFYFSEKLFYYQSDFFILTCFLSIVVSFFWSFFRSFKSPEYIFFFLLGIYFFFGHHFIWVFPILFLLFSFFMNSIYLGYLFTILFSFLSVVFFDTNYLFLGGNAIILGVFFIRYYPNISNYFSQKNTSLLAQFKHRN